MWNYNISTTKNRNEDLQLSTYNCSHYGIMQSHRVKTLYIKESLVSLKLNKKITYFIKSNFEK